MPQLFQVLKCFKCSVFQVHQTKKSNKWECKLCGEKQSMKRHYGLGTGKECRIHVQKLNGIRGEQDELSESILLNKSSDEECNEREIITPPTKINRKSKWSNFTDETEVTEESNVNESMYLGNAEVVLEVPIRQRKKFKPPNAIPEPTSIIPIFETNKSKNQDKVLESGMSDSFFKTNSRLKPNLSNTLPRNDTISRKNHDSISNDTKFNNINDVVDEDNNEKFTIQDIKRKETYIPPKVDNSKWAQFVEEPEDDSTSISRENPYENISPSKETVYQQLFSCDDNELDEVLDF